MRATVLYFASARERAGVRMEEVELPPGANVETALNEVAMRHPELTALLPHLRISLNQEFVDRNALVPPDAELALIPPVAGG